MSGGRTCKLTNSVIKSLVATGSDYDVRDTLVTGFHVRVTKGGQKIFRFQYKNAAGKRPVMTIGPVGQLTVEEARKIARDYLVQTRSGKDPAAERHRKNAAATVGDLWDLYRREHVCVKNRENTAAEKERNWATHVAPFLASSKIEDVTRNHIYEIRNRMAHIPANANIVIALLSSMFSFAIKRDLCSANPVSGVEKFPKRAREICFSWDQMDRIVAAVMSEKSEWVRCAMMLLITTGARRGEVLGAEWSEMDLDSDEPVWRIPSRRMKGKRVHTYLLDIRMAEMLKAWKPAACLLSSRWVFPNDKGTGPKTKLQKEWVRIKKVAGVDDVEDAVLHGLRHTFITHLAMQGGSAFDIQNIAGHADIATSARYVHATQNTRIRQMVEQNSSGVWAAMEEADKKGEVLKLHPS